KIRAPRASRTIKGVIERENSAAGAKNPCAGLRRVGYGVVGVTAGKRRHEVQDRKVIHVLHAREHARSGSYYPFISRTERDADARLKRACAVAPKLDGACRARPARRNDGRQ